jgi:hypothetical protein
MSNISILVQDDTGSHTLYMVADVTPGNEYVEVIADHLTKEDVYDLFRAKAIRLSDAAVERDLARLHFAPPAEQN